MVVMSASRGTLCKVSFLSVNSAATISGRRGVLGAGDADLALELAATPDADSIHGRLPQIFGKVTPRWP